MRARAWPAVVLGVVVVSGLVLVACLRDGEERALADMDVGVATASGMRVQVAEGLAHVRAIQPGRVGGAGEIHLRASAPAFAAALVPEASASDAWTITVSNCMPDTVLAATAPAVVMGAGPGPHPARAELPVVELDSPHPTVRRWRIDVAPMTTALRTGMLPSDQAADVEMRIEPLDAGASAPDEVWRFAVMGDIQTGMSSVHEVFQRINQDPTLRFVVSTGDLVDKSVASQYDLLERQLETLSIPYYSTIGNHELFGDPTPWRERFGRFNLHFRFKGVAFSLVDSGNASLDPLVYTWLDQWLDAAVDDVHLFFTHFPPRDPIGVRNGSFRSANEAKKLLSRLAEGKVDATFYGHIHSFYAYSNAGIPAYISGGGGAIPERWDGIGRHYLAVDVSATGVEQVAVVRVD